MSRSSSFEARGPPVGRGNLIALPLWQSIMNFKFEGTWRLLWSALCSDLLGKRPCNLSLPVEIKLPVRWGRVR